MKKPLPLFDLGEITRVQRECALLRSKIARGGMDIRSRLRTERKLAIAIARQLQLETRLYKGGRHV